MTAGGITSYTSTHSCLAFMQRPNNRGGEILFSSYQILLCILELKYFTKSFASKTGDKLWFVIRSSLSFEMVSYKILYIHIN